MVESGLTKQQILSELSRSPHGKLTEYVPVARKAAQQEAEFFAHLIAWDFQKGQVRDAKVALPVTSLSVAEFPDEFVENSLAHLAMLNPRELLKAYRFALELRLPGRMRSLRRLVANYIEQRESNVAKWDRVAVQHRHVLKELAALAHVKHKERANIVLHGRTLDREAAALPKDSVFEILSQLKDMKPSEAAGVIMEERIPFIVARGALGAKLKDPDLVLALIQRMTPTELSTNMKFLERLGVKTNPALRGALEEALQKASKSKKNVLKTTRAAEAIEDEDLKAKLRGLQDRQVQSISVEGNWLVAGDKSGSMTQAVELAKEVSAVLAKVVKGKVWLVYFDTMPQAIDVTGMPLDVIKNVTKYIKADGGTSIGCALQRMLEAKEEVDGIAIVSDGGENNAPSFCDVYKRYSAWVGKEVPVYLYQTVGDPPQLLYNARNAGLDIQVFDMTKGIDYYSLPNIVQTMRTNRYSLIEEVMATPLLKLAEVVKITRKEDKVHA